MRDGTEVQLKDGRIVFLKNISSEMVEILIKEESDAILEALDGENYFDIRISDIEKIPVPEKATA